MLSVHFEGVKPQKTHFTSNFHFGNGFLLGLDTSPLCCIEFFATESTIELNSPSHGGPHQYFILGAYGRNLHLTF